MVIVEDGGAVLFDIICPDGGLCEGVAPAIGEGVQCDDELLELIAEGDAIGAGEVVVGDLGDQHVALVPPGLGEQEEGAEKEEGVQLHWIIM